MDRGVSGDANGEYSLKQAIRDGERGILRPSYLLYGEEEFLIADALATLINILLPETDRDLNLFFMEGEQVDMEGLCHSLLTPPLIPGRKVVVVRNTRVFQSTHVSPAVIREIRENMTADPDRAAMDFMHFLRLTGWRLDDLKDGGWKKIRDDEWQKAVPEDSGDDRGTWLPGIIDMCLQHGITQGSAVPGDERLYEILKSGLPEGNHLIMTAGAVDKRKKIFKAIAEAGKVFHFPRIKTEYRKKKVLMDTMRNVLADAGKTVTPAAWLVMGRKTGFDAACSVAALEKLITYTGEKTVIEEKDVEEAVGKTKEGTLFDLTGALAAKDLPRALVALKELFDQGVHHLAILAMIIREIRFLLHAGMFVRSGKIESFDPKMEYGGFQKRVYPLIKSWTEGAGKKETGGGEFVRQHPYVMYQAFIHSCRFSFADLVEYMEELVAMDIAMKSTARDPILLIERFLCEVCRKSS